MSNCDNVNYNNTNINNLVNTDLLNCICNGGTIYISYIYKYIHIY